MKIEYCNKFLVIENEGKRAFVLGDLHLGYEASLRQAGILVAEHLFESLIEEIDNCFEKIGKVDEVVILGDVKHSFGTINYYEKDQFVKLVNYLLERSKKIIIIKGNHDVLIDYLPKLESVEIKDNYIIDKTLFLHGDKEFSQLEDKTNRVIMGHLHPAVIINEGVKSEKFKCFLKGKYKSREFIILPSATGKNEGTDFRDYEYKAPWSFNLLNFDVIVCGDNGENYKFGKLRNI